MACFRVVKPADPSSERPSPTKDSPAVPSIAWASEGKERPDSAARYLQRPEQRRGSSGTRNLFLGVVILIVALGLLGQAVVLLGARAVYPLGTALLTLVAIFVLARSRVLRQRNGGFVALAIICLIGALAALAEYGGNRLAGGSATSQPAKDAVRTSEELPLLTQSYEIPAAEENANRFKVLRDLRVVIDEKAHLIKAGEIFPVAETGDGEVRFVAGDQQIALPLNFVEMIKPAVATPGEPSADQPQVAATMPDAAPVTEPQHGVDPAAPQAMTGDPLPQDETPSQVTQRAQKEAIRRYPALGQKDSPENQLFIETYQELKHSGADDFFADPQWPIHLAELLAKRENWQRQE